MSKHTPGPWKVSASHPQNACAYVLGGGDEVAICFAAARDAIAKATGGAQ